MQLSNLRARDVYQNVPASSCQELAGICMENLVIIICIVVLVVGLSLLTLSLKLRARLRSIRQARSRSANPLPPPYSNIGFPPSASRTSSLSKTGSDSSNSPSFDPYRIIPPSLDSSLLLKDDYFSQIPHPDPTLAPSRSAPSPHLPSGVGLGFGPTVQTGPATPTGPLPLTPLPPVYVQDPRRGAEDPIVL
ncbi:hypothetical protein DFH09DRAFT_1389912 [Mycena vulgaris]|nr:hypothetical protein DFH09DRAFT_1389912 [Mycena vulgaris]